MEGVFVDPDIWKIMKNDQFESFLKAAEKYACLSFMDVMHNLLWNSKATNYMCLVKNMINNF